MVSTLSSICKFYFNKEQVKLRSQFLRSLWATTKKRKKIYKRWYHSRQITAPVEDIFKGRQPRHDKSEMLSMHRKRDPHAPKKLPKDISMQALADDKVFQGLLQSRIQLKRLTQPERRENMHEISRKITKRRDFVRKQRFKSFRLEWFKGRSGRIMSSSEPLASKEPPTPLITFRPHRQAVIKALYPSERGTLCTRPEALECLLRYCKGNEKDTYTEVPPAFSLELAGPASSRATPPKLVEGGVMGAVSLEQTSVQLTPPALRGKLMD